MRRTLIVLLLLASGGLGLWVRSVFDGPPVIDGAPVTGGTRPLPSAPSTAVRDDSQRRRDNVLAVLARPVFSSTRRPRADDAAPAPAAAAMTTLPRMMAILIDGKARSAIFDGNGKPTVLREGGHLGPFTIQTIEPQQVTVIGPDGKRILRTSFSNDPPSAAALTPGLPPVMPTLPLGVFLPAGMPIVGQPNPGLPTAGPPR